MTKELFIDLCARLPYDIKIKIPTLQEDAIFTLVAICEDYITIMKDNGSCFDIYNSIEVFPFLRPMSSMTEKENKEYENCYQSDDTTTATLLVDFYNKKHFDYRGLISKGLAIAVTKDNNPYK